MTSVDKLRHDKKMNFRVLRFAVLAFLLLFAQQGAAVHALAHFSDFAPTPSSQDKQLPHSSACDKCISYSHMGGALHASGLVFHAADLIFVQSGALSLGIPTVSVFPYAARAPPHLV